MKDLGKGVMCCKGFGIRKWVAESDYLGRVLKMFPPVTLEDSKSLRPDEVMPCPYCGSKI